MHTFIQTQKQTQQASSVSASANSRACSSQSQTVRSILQLQRKTGNQSVQLIPMASTPADPYEQEADRVAEHVMRMPDTTVQKQAETSPPFQTKTIADTVTPLVRRQPEAKEEKETVRDSVVAQQGNSGITEDIRLLSGKGEPLSLSERTFFEPRFGRDFSDVRLHTGIQAARVSKSIEAQAFTFGRNIAFSAGHYSPGTSTGRRLLAHELTHIVQQRRFPTIQRKIKTSSGVSLKTYFTVKHPGYSVSGSIYSAPAATKMSLNQQILSDLLSSNRVFTLPGNDQNDAVSSLRSHIGSREATVNFAKKRSYRFAAGKKMEMNTDFWGRTAEGKWAPRKKPGLDEKTTALNAYKDLNINAKEYAIACHAAAQITMWVGSNYTALKRDNNVDDNDWIPGDWGYIKNLLHKSHSSSPLAINKTPGEEGENIICTGKNEFWGHSSDKNPYASLAGWFKRIIALGNSLPRLMKWRDRTQIGLATKTQSPSAKAMSPIN